jgi:acyl carrier protein
MADREELVNCVYEAIAQTVGVDRQTLTPETTVVSLGIDSLKFSEVLMQIEETTGLLADDAFLDKAATIATLGDLSALILGLQEASAAAPKTQGAAL